MAADYPSFPSSSGALIPGTLEWLRDRARRAFGSSNSSKPRNPPSATATYPSRATIQSVAPREYRQALAGEGSIIPELYGRVRVPARVATVLKSGSSLLMLCVWGKGEIQAVDSIRIENALFTGTATHYLGTTGQTANAALAAAIPGYADTLAGIAYSVLKITSADQLGKSVIGEIRGRLVYDPRTTTTVYSTNPALALADFIDRHTRHTMDWASVEDAADACDDLMTSGAKRREIGLAMTSRASVYTWAETLREYAGCLIDWSGDAVRLVPLIARATDHAITAGLIQTIAPVKRGMDQLPNRVTVTYTDTSADEWRKGTARTPYPTGEELREQTIDLPGIQSYAQAYRQAMERCNHYALCDLSATLDVFDEGLEIAVGDVITVTHDIGLTAKPMRVLSAETTSPGRWRIAADEYDPAVYSDAEPNGPTFSDTDLPAPGVPDAPASITLSESVYQLQNGDYAARISIAWPAVADPYIGGYRVKVTGPAGLVFTAETASLSILTPQLQELVAYTVEVRAFNLVAESAGTFDVITLAGKYTVPDGPASISGYEVASEVRLFWPADTSDFDIRRYEIRYGTTAGSWATADVLDQVDALTYTTRAIPAGTWRFYVNSIDSIGQYGTTPATVDIEVTLDDSAYLAHSEDCTSGTPTLTYSAVEEVRGSGVTTFYSDGGDTWATMFGGAAMSTFTNSMASYQTAAGTSEWISAAVAVGASTTGDWLGTVTYTDHNGTATAQLGLSADNVTYTWGNLSQRGTARYAKIRVQSTGIFSVRVPGPNIQLRVIARETNGSGTSSASGVVTVSTGVPCSAFKMITIVPNSDSQYTWSVSNQVTGATPSFDVSIRNTAGSRVAVAFLWATRTV